MRRLQSDREANVREKFFHCLSGQRVNEVAIDVLNPIASQVRQGGEDIVVAMRSPEQFEFLLIAGLDAQTDAVDAILCDEKRKIIGHVVGIGFDGIFF